jgi:hypothetical protein
MEGNIFRCAACNFLVCTTHDEAFHVGETCEEYDERKDRERKIQDDASAQKIQDTTKHCPGENCSVPIEKNNGCDHMRCRLLSKTGRDVIQTNEKLRSALQTRVLLDMLGTVCWYGRHPTNRQSCARPKLLALESSTTPTSNYQCYGTQETSSTGHHF